MAFVPHMHAAWKWVMNSAVTDPAMKPMMAATFYQFATVTDCESLAQLVRRSCQANHITGTVLIAPEGINGTVCGQPRDVRKLLDTIRADQRFANMAHKESFSDARPLKRLKVKIKPEIITMRAPEVDAANNTGEYVAPADWNALISRPDVVLVDTRNDYEVAIGTFRGAINPQTSSFSELTEWVDQHESLKNKPPVAMYCTGGIRCEKSTALLKARGFDNVYHLHGGILKYLEDVDESDSLFEGECFVFDERVSVNHQLEPGSYAMCQACGHPVSDADKQDSRYADGVSCPHCHDKCAAQHDN